MPIYVLEPPASAFNHMGNAHPAERLVALVDKH
jgi:hypothetical protein